MNKIQQIWKVFFTETNLHHSVQIFKSFIFVKKYEKNITYFCIHSQNNGKFMTFIMYSLEFRATKKNRFN